MRHDIPLRTIVKLMAFALNGSPSSERSADVPGLGLRTPLLILVGSADNQEFTSVQKRHHCSHLNPMAKLSL